MYCRDPVLSGSWRAVMDHAVEAIAAQYPIEDSKPAHKALAKLLKSIITSRRITEESLEEISSQFGMEAHHIAHFFPLYTRLSRAVSWLQIDPHIATYHHAAVVFGDKGSHRALYRAAVSSRSLEPLFEISVNVATNVLTISARTTV
jgi:hypothetical protein